MIEVLDDRNCTGGAVTGWRDHIKVHPAADLFPMMSDDELRALGEDIKKRGLTVHLCFWSPSQDRWEKGESYLLDGRNRLEAMERAGIEIPFADGLKGVIKRIFLGDAPDGRYADPYAFVISANIHRRHLTAEKKLKLVDDVLRLVPTRSDRQIAKETKTSPTTVGKRRRKLEKQGLLSTVDTRTDARGSQRPAHKQPAPGSEPHTPAAPEECGVEASAVGEAAAPTGSPAQGAQPNLVPAEAPNPLALERHVSVIRAAIQGVINIRNIMETDLNVAAFFLSPERREEERSRVFEAVELLREWDDALVGASTSSAAA
jgi:DNA-binding Lrp family transcriptional regulator